MNELPVDTDYHARVSAAAEAVAARGENPTLAAVRTELDGGSYSTIAPYLKAWRAARRDTGPVREPLPERIAEAALASAGETWHVAMELSSERVAAERAALEATRAELDASVAEATQTADDLLAELERVQSAAATAAETAAQTEAELRQSLETERAQGAEAKRLHAVAQALADERQQALASARAEAQSAATTAADTEAQLRDALDAARAESADERQARAVAEARATAAEVLAEERLAAVERAHALLDERRAADATAASTTTESPT